MIPKHSNPKSERRQARAPYNFVPLPEKVVTVDYVPPQDVYAAYAGYIECTLTTESPLYTRCAMTTEFFKKWGEKAFYELPEAQKSELARFFSLQDDSRPVIPGSSLRGMVRSLVEIAGYGKVQWVTPQQLVYRGVGDPSSLGGFYRGQLLGKNKTNLPNTHLDYPSKKLKGGYLRKDKGRWAIQPATEHQGESFVHVEYQDANPITRGQHGRQRIHDVYAAPASRIALNRGRRGPGDLILDIAITSKIMARHAGQTTPPPGMVPAKLIESGHMGGKHAKHWHCVIFESDPSAGWISIPDDMWEVYREDRDLTRGLPTRELANDGDPLFYLLDDTGQLVFFGPTMMFRLPYPNSPLDLAPSELQRESDIDLAEAIFGYTKSNAIPEKDRACAGRISFTDAHFESDRDGVWLAQQLITPKILGSPKPTSFQHYLAQQEPDDKRELDHYASPPPHKTVIRGHKLYWHQGEIGIDDIQEQDQARIAKAPKQYTQIKPVRAGVTFRFRIYFENLRKFELGALLWTLTLPGESDKVYCHKLGMGKPLGMGSVRIQPTLYISDRAKDKENRYTRLFKKDAQTWHLAEEQEQDLTPFINEFETYILDRMDQNERGEAETLKEIKRIRMLLQMLEWPGPDKHLTEYMDLSEFRPRPVLPDPLAVVAGQPVQPPIRRRDLRQPTGAPSEVRPGTVKWFSDAKGYGFIEQEDGTEVFVHHTGILGSGRRSLKEGQRVTFTVVQEPKGPKAQNVQPAIEGIVHDPPQLLPPLTPNQSQQTGELTGQLLAELPT